LNTINCTLPRYGHSTSLLNASWRIPEGNRRGRDPFDWGLLKKAARSENEDFLRATVSYQHYIGKKSLSLYE
jgi:hypothetical protein